MNIMIFDTETTSLDKPFCYNVGYIIVDSDTAEVIIKRDFVVEQVWHNPMLFTTAYYADKRELYIKSMRSRKTTMDKFGYICQRMIRDIKNFEVDFQNIFLIESTKTQENLGNKTHGTDLRGVNNDLTRQRRKPQKINIKEI